MESYEDHLDSCPFCHYKNTEERGGRLILKPGTILQGRYIVGTPRGEGETDLTYIGWDELFDRKVLIQEFFPANLATRDANGGVVPLQGKEADLLKWTNEFVRQRENLIRLYESPDVVCVFSAFRDNGTAYMTCQYADSPTLGDYLSENGPVKVQLAKAFLDQAVHAVWEVHQIGLIHGNICPESFWMTSGERRLVLKDFAEPAHFCGRPDLKDYGKAGSWTDVRGLALLYASMLAGAVCRDEKTAAAVFAREKKMLSDIERKTLQEALQAANGSPVSTVKAFARGILGERRTEELTLQDRHQPVHPGRRRKSGSSRLMAAGIGAIILLLAVMVLVTFGRNGEKEEPPETSPAIETTEETEDGSPEETESSEYALKAEMQRNMTQEAAGETTSGNLSDATRPAAEQEQTKAQDKDQEEEKAEKKQEEQTEKPAEKPTEKQPEKQPEEQKKDNKQKNKNNTGGKKQGTPAAAAETTPAAAAETTTAAVPETTTAAAAETTTAAVPETTTAAAAETTPAVQPETPPAAQPATGTVLPSGTTTTYEIEPVPVTTAAPETAAAPENTGDKPGGGIQADAERGPGVTNTVDSSSDKPQETPVPDGGNAAPITSPEGGDAVLEGPPQ